MIYLDSCIVVYWVENHSVFAPRIEQRVLQVTSVEFAISPLVMAEVLVTPFRQHNVVLIERYKAFFENCVVLSMPETIFVETARLRATFSSLKMPDALHLATARFHQCEVFWTNDEHLQRIIGDYIVNVCSN
jgi:uncharacterized protein